MNATSGARNFGLGRAASGLTAGFTGATSRAPVLTWIPSRAMRTRRVRSGGPAGSRIQACRGTSIARRGDDQVLAAVDLIHGRGPSESAAHGARPQHLTGVGVIGPDLAVAAEAENETARRRQHTDPHLRDACALDPFRRQPCIVSETNLPLDRAGVEVIARQLGERRLHHDADGAVGIDHVLFGRRHTFRIRDRAPATTATRRRAGLGAARCDHGTWRQVAPERGASPHRRRCEQKRGQRVHVR